MDNTDLDKLDVMEKYRRLEAEHNRRMGRHIRPIVGTFVGARPARSARPADNSAGSPLQVIPGGAAGKLESVPEYFESAPTAAESRAVDQLRQRAAQRGGPFPPGYGF